MDNFNQNNLQNGTENGAPAQQPSVNPNTPPVKPQQPNTNPYSAPVQPTQPSANPYNAPVQPTQPNTNQYNAPVQPGQPNTNQYNAPVQPPRPANGNFTQAPNGQYNPYTQTTQNQYQQTNYANQPQQPVDDAEEKGIAPMVLGIVSIVAAGILCCFSPIAIIPGIIGLVLGIKAKGSISGKRSGKAVAGIITSAIAIGIGLLWLITDIYGVFFYNDDYNNDFWKEYRQLYGEDDTWDNLSDMSVGNVQFSDGQVIVNVK